MMSLAFLVLSIWLVTVNGLNVTILHTNDIHSRFVPFDSKMKACENVTNLQNSGSKKNVACYGGAARRLTAIKQMRDKYENVLLLDGGDQFQGTLWYTLLKWKPISEVVSAMKYDAMSFGNHEFDDGLSHNDKKLGEIGLAPYLKNVNATFVATNVETTANSNINNLYKNHLILELNGQKYGVLGYVTPETANISHPGGTVTFKNEIESLKQGVKKLQDEGVNKIFAIGHSGIDVDKKICQEVKGIDVVVGGHTNTFLYTGTPPTKPEPEGVYPLVFGEDQNSPCLVVQDYAFGKYLGFLQVDFDDNGVIKAWNGNPILMDDTYPDDPEILTILKQYSDEIDVYQKLVIGSTAVALNGSRWVCRLRECNFGNVFTDAMIHSYLQKKWEQGHGPGSGWATSAVAIVNSACWRDFTAEPMVQITMADLFNTLVYANTVELIQIKGQYIWEALEHSVFEIEKTQDDPHGKFLQVSGLKVKYDLRKESGRRVQSVFVKCANCSVPSYKPLIKEKAYYVVVVSFLKGGGDGYSMIKNNLLYSDGLETLDVDVFKEYIVKKSPLTTGLEGRITFASAETDSADCPVSGVFKGKYLNSLLLLIVAFVSLGTSLR